MLEEDRLGAPNKAWGLGHPPQATRQSERVISTLYMPSSLRNLLEAVTWPEAEPSHGNPQNSSG